MVTMFVYWVECRTEQAPVTEGLYCGTVFIDAALILTIGVLLASSCAN